MPAASISAFAVLSARLDTLHGLGECGAALLGLVCAARSRVTVGAVTVAKRPSFFSVARRDLARSMVVRSSGFCCSDFLSVSLMVTPPIRITLNKSRRRRRRRVAGRVRAASRNAAHGAAFDLVP